MVPSQRQGAMVQWSPLNVKILTMVEVVSSFTPHEFGLIL